MTCHRESTGESEVPAKQNTKIVELAAKGAFTNENIHHRIIAESSSKG
jgi:hypothetical protein